MRALRGVLENDVAARAGLILMEPLGKVQNRNFRRAMVPAGDWDVSGISDPRLPVLTVEEILNGRRFFPPGVVGRSEAHPALPMDPDTQQCA